MTGPNTCRPLIVLSSCFSFSHFKMLFNVHNGNNNDAFVSGGLFVFSIYRSQSFTPYLEAAVVGVFLCEAELI